MDEEKKTELSPENKALAEQAIRNYVEASRRVALAEEDKEDAKYRKKIVK